MSERSAVAKSKKNIPWMPVFLLVFLPFLAIVLSSMVLWRGVQNYLSTSNYFNVRELKVEGIADQRYVALMKQDIVGVNIFRVNMSNLAQRIRQRFPTFTSVTVRRVLPSQLYVIAKERVPVAVIKKDASYVLDAEGVALMQFPLQAVFQLPVIVGLEQKISGIKVGGEVDPRLLHRTLLMARALRTHALAVRVTKIDASDPAHPFFYLDPDLPVKVRDKDYEAQLELLPAILRSLGADISGVSYIDLRPKEPVIGMKEKDRKKK